MSDASATVKAGPGRSAAQAWSRALANTASILQHPHRTLPVLVDEVATRHGDRPALLSHRACLTYRQLVERSRQYATWAVAQGVRKGDVVALLMPNEPEYVAIWFGITRVGGIVALLNTNLGGASLAHCIDVARPAHLIVGAELVDTLLSADAHLASRPVVWCTGGPDGRFQDLDAARDASSAASSGLELQTASVDDVALYIFTSGTSGLPKAARVSHARVLQWSLWFAGLMDTSPGDRMYDCLPMYHSVGGVQAVGALLAAGGSVFVRERFSAREFWKDVAAWDCTLFQYIGELCRYLLHAAPQPEEAAHRLRLCCGNGLRADVWSAFKTRFHIPQILEFYAATEGNVSLFNVEEVPGAIGRIPPYLAHRFPAALIEFDVETEAPRRDERGFCIRCAPHEVGEAVGRVGGDASNVGGRFEGYTSDEASERKVIRNVFQAGDAWFRTGDLMRRDEKGYVYFVDRVGDTFRWKGENVSTSEVAAVVSECAGVKDANAYGVTVPGAEGRAGMVAVVVDAQFDAAALRALVKARLPEYARPVFLRVTKTMTVTTTFKHQKADLVRQGFDPRASDDELYFDDPRQQAFVRVDEALFDQLQTEGAARLRQQPASPGRDGLLDGPI